ncbi:MAG: NrfD/PsrC family molybdoenzyme membrane anchor subunit, partial [Acidimicrobiia bacterium]|nr:NrfD/PsrC family molybdoenzyme membrane anchor subunit [Acidimicrobiia bacterium]
MTVASSDLAATHPDDLRSAAMAPVVTRPGRGFRALMIGLGLVVGAGAVAYVYQLVNGLGVTGKNDQVFWGLYTTNLVTFVGFSYGGATVSAVLRLTHASWRGPISRIAEATALVTLAIGAAFPLIHLGHPEQVWRILTNFQINSPIT